ncbi:hypothetical protein HH310_25555 [Actinoplanes sp. TBRC 11911]|uniref:hypothetical protein n=1 Tax=Actinoplanes sp. TBRC 11911 TaxID=2729386 RepID=UPI00145D24D2|nr:hypothetical protein [Actinoplanes sp. TBRC 11911]NMO54536.1 hypothetical protein [Actinoplanes sp. TBRC 11911]
MYELSRVRLHSIGPKGARYQDVTIDLREVGPVLARPVQQALFDTSGSAGVLRRPSPASVLFLENGGGKTVLMKLIFSVMLPGRRNVLGSTNTRVLEDYVLAADLAQVALEWQHTRTGERVVTGKASEWRGHTVSSDPNRLTELWYTFRPSASFNLDTLPLTVDGRLVTLAGFRDRLSQAGKAEPRLGAAYETTQGEWVKKLKNFDLDPELFRYQRAMNAGEGEAADAFTFKSDEAFVDFLLRAVTDEEDPRGLADVLAGYATKLAQRGSLIAERDFVAGALERLTPLTRAAVDARAAADLAQTARRDAEALVATLIGRQRNDAHHLDHAGVELEQISKTENAADQDVRRLGAIALELRRLVAGLRLQAAEQVKAALEDERDRIKDLLTAWQATGAATTYREATAAADTIRDLVEVRQEEARPALRARDLAARALARALLDVAANAEQNRVEDEKQATTIDEQAAAADQAGQEAVRKNEQANAQLAAAQEQIDQAQIALRAAADKGLLTAIDRVEQDARTARRLADEAQAILSQGWQRLPELIRERKSAEKELNKLQNAHRHAAAEADRRAQRVQDAVQRTDELAGTPRLADVLGADTVDLDADAATALERLTEAIQMTDAQRAGLQNEQAADERVLSALGDGGLLPPSQPVTAALVILEAARITAWAGWSYLAQLPTADRDHVLHRYPHLIDGLVLNNSDHLAEAQQLLTEARLLPATIIAVGTTATLQHSDLPMPTGLEFLVPPNPALYDDEAAAREREHLTTAHRERAARISELTAQADVDRQLAQRIRTWRHEYPEGELRRLALTDQEAAAATDAAMAAVDTGEKIRDMAAAAEEELQQRLPALDAVAKQAADAAEQLADLAERAVRIPGWSDEVRAARETMASAERELGAATRQAGDLRRQATTIRDRAGDHRRIRDASREELGRLPGAGSVDVTDPLPTELVPELRERHRTATEAYLRVEVGADLLRELRAVEDKEAAARAAWEAVPSNVRTTALALLATPEGTDTAARTAATSRTDRDLQEVGRRIDQAATHVGSLRSEYSSFIPQERSLDPYGKPHDIEHGEDLINQASADYTAARRTYDNIKGKREALEQRINQTRQAVDAFSAVIESLSDVAAPTVFDEVAAFEGDVDLARTHRNEVRQTLTEADGMLAEASRTVRMAADVLAQYAVDPEFEHVISPVRRQIIAVDRETLPNHSADWQTALEPRLRTLDDDLTQINEHRAGIITRLHGIVDAALRTLRLAQRLSKLPSGMGDWSGQEFLRIRFTEPDPNVLREYLGHVVDDAADASADKQRRSKDGLSLVLQGVHAAMPKGVVVEMLKPDAVLRTERVRVASISDVFSGGQLLTAAIILYCTMAALRANERGDTSRPHAGVLFLDNPIGRASAGYLLELQLAVAQTLGVQLIYTTGLFDTNALSVFPLVVRLRNDADLRAGLKYLSIDSEMRRPLEEIGEPDGSGRLTATRVFLRPTTPT